MTEDIKTCYICLEEDSNIENFIPAQACKCKNLDVHINCFMHLNCKYVCTVCKSKYQDFRFKIDNEVIRYFKYGIVENYFENSEGEKDGLYILKIEDKEILIHCFYEKNIRHGLYQGFYRNKNAKEHGCYIKGKKNGMYYKWFENRNLKEYREYKLGIPNGNQEFYQENGNLILSYKILNNKLEGEFKICYPDGKLWIESNFCSGMLHGNFKEWNQKGNLVSNFKLEDGTFVDLRETFNLIIDFDLCMKFFVYVMFIFIFFKF